MLKGIERKDLPYNQICISLMLSEYNGRYAEVQWIFKLPKKEKT